MEMDHNIVSFEYYVADHISYEGFNHEEERK